MSGKYEDYHGKRYHGRRRNAQDYGHYRRDDDSNQRTAPSSSGFDHNRIGTGGAIGRKYNPSSHYKNPRLTKTILNTIKDNDVAMKKDTIDSQDKINGSRFRYAANTISSIVNVKVKAPRLAIGESTESEKTLLTMKPYCKLAIMDQSLFDIIVQFTQQYFTCFDKNRDELLAAYHSNAFYSVSLNLNKKISIKAPKFDDYFFRDSRNLLYVEGGEKKFRMLHRGNFDIVAYIKKMPPTEHDSDSLRLDCGYFQPNMINFSITGVFREGKSDGPMRTFRNFQRTFICVPAPNNKMVIVNEQFTISNLTESQAKHYKDEISKMQMTTDELPQEQYNKTLTATTSKITTNEEQMKSLMIEEFSRRSGLNKDWSRDVLDHSKWDMNAAEKNFVEHKNGIPKEAFIVPFK